MDVKCEMMLTREQDLDPESYAAVRTERFVTSDISSLLQNKERFAAAFDEEANFCAGATQIHTHSPSCVKYSIGKRSGQRGQCRFGAPWKRVDKTGFTDDGVLQIRRKHRTVNRWNQAMAVGLRHNHDISLIGSKCKSLAIVFYLTNYATKVEDPTWKRVAVARDLFQDPGNAEVQNPSNVVQGSAEGEERENRTRKFLMRVANRVFTERALSQVEVVAHLLGYGMEFASNEAWTFLNVTSLFWYILRRWQHLQREAGVEIADERGEEAILLEKAGQKISAMEAYEHRGKLLADFSLYEYMSVVTFRRKSERRAMWGEVEFDDSWPQSEVWVQRLRSPGKEAAVCLDGYLCMDFNEEDETYYRR